MLRVLQENTRFPALHIASALTQHAHRRGFGGSNFSSPVRNGWPGHFAARPLMANEGTRPCSSRGISSFGRNDWHNPITRQLFYESVQKVGLIKYNGGLQVHSSFLNMVLHERD